MSSLFGELVIYSFTGTQNGMTNLQKERLFEQLDWPFEKSDDERQFHHGDCIGADEEAHVYALALKYDIYIHPCNIKEKRAFCRAAKHVYDEMPPLERNKFIAKAGHKLFATPKATEEKRSGTWFTVRFARKLKIPIVIIMPDGKLILEN